MSYDETASATVSYYVHLAPPEWRAVMVRLAGPLTRLPAISPAPRKSTRREPLVPPDTLTGLRSREPPKSCATTRGLQPSAHVPVPSSPVLSHHPSSLPCFLALSTFRQAPLGPLTGRAAPPSCPPAHAPTSADEPTWFWIGCRSPSMFTPITFAPVHPNLAHQRSARCVSTTFSH